MPGHAAIGRWYLTPAAAVTFGDDDRVVAAAAVAVQWRDEIAPLVPGGPRLLDLAPHAVAVLSLRLELLEAEARQGENTPPWFREPDNPPATQDELEKMFAHLEAELERGRFFHPEDKAPLMKRNLRAPFLRARLTQQEAQTLRGVIKALTIGRGGRKRGEE